MPTTVNNNKHWIDVYRSSGVIKAVQVMRDADQSVTLEEAKIVLLYISFLYNDEAGAKHLANLAREWAITDQGKLVTELEALVDLEDGPQ